MNSTIQKLASSSLK